ncbi:MAG: YlxM family DNA-binding protein [Christensenellales bacterium]|jgi:predicted DNA-binding protein YlxM (UPF0122 family)
MQIEKNVRICDLFDIYGCFLSEKQQKLINEYYFLDNSLSEIAENNGISRQAAFDSLSKSEKKLEEFEEKLSLLQIKKALLKFDENKNAEEILLLIKNLI